MAIYTKINIIKQDGNKINEIPSMQLLQYRPFEVSYIFSLRQFVIEPTEGFKSLCFVNHEIKFV